MVRRFKELLLITTTLMVVESISLLAMAKGNKKSDSVYDELNLKNAKTLKEQDMKALKTELLVQQTEARALKQITKLIHKYKGSPLEPDMQMRLAELYVRQAKSARFFEINRDSSTVVQFTPKMIKSSSSRNIVLKAINVYDYIEKNFPDYENIDLVIFNSAMSRQQIGKNKEAEALYWKLVKNYNYSPLVPDAHLAIGEINFDAKKFKNALDHFLAIKKYPDSRVYPYGVYKGAWAYYNLQQAGQGLKELEEVVRYGRDVAENNADARLDLRKEALNDMAVFFEEVYPASMAYSYFKIQSKGLEFEPYIFRMMNLYEVHGRFSDREVVLSDFISKENQSLRLAEAYKDRVNNFEEMKDRSSAIVHLKKYEELCTDSNWLSYLKKQPQIEPAKKSGDSPVPTKFANAIEDCSKEMSRTSIKLAEKWHNLWKKNPTYPEFADFSEAGFDIYLKYNTTTNEARKARYVFAEMLFNRNKYLKASEQYALTATYYIDPVKLEKSQGKYFPQPQVSHDARYAAIVAVEKKVGKKKWDKDHENLFVKRVKDYAFWHPDGKYRLDVEFRVGMIAYDNSRYEEAREIFYTLGEKYQIKEKGIKSQDIYLDILNLKKDYSGLKKYTTVLLGREKNKDRKYKLQKIYEESYFLLVQQDDDKGNKQQALDGYFSFAKENPSSKLASKAWENGIALYYNLGRLMDGAEASIKFSQLFPEEKSVHALLLQAAQSFEKMGRLQKAADVLVAASSKNEKEAEKWKLVAADFYYINGQEDKALKLYQELSRSKSVVQVNESINRIELITAEKPFSKEHIAALNAVIDSEQQPAAGFAQLRFAQKAFELKDWPKAFSEAKRVISMKGASASSKAKARILQAHILGQEFENQSMKTTVERLSLVLGLKTQRLEKAQRAYEGAIKYGDAYVAVEALESLAQLYKKYVLALQEMPTPRGLSDVEAQQFRGELEKISFPMEEKSIDTYQQALLTAKNFKLRDGSIPRLEKMLDRINMVKKIEVPVRLVDLEPMLPESESGGRL